MYPEKEEYDDSDKKYRRNINKERGWDREFLEDEDPNSIYI